jgi:radical SAM superfamily enzyme YgiQ (UPF0313 family)
MSNANKSIILIDLPVFPKGVIALSLYTVAACFKPHYSVSVIDLNMEELPDAVIANPQNILFGLKVSAQSFAHAIEVTQKIKSRNPAAIVVWGGELPTLLPDECLKYAHTIVSGLFEPVADEFIADLNNHCLKNRYTGANHTGQPLVVPDFSFMKQPQRYYSFMGLPLETSRGCTEKCIFCMVHQMQKKNYNLKTIDHLRQFIKTYEGSFINVVDYNFGVNEAHVVEVAHLIKNSGAIGWMAEMCIELLDNDRVLQALSESHCKIIYCGLESIDQYALNSVHKMNTNHIENYERIIRKAQSYGVQVAAGIILGLEGTHPNTFAELYKFFQRVGIIYAKLTFLTYNPGTKVYEYEKKKGKYVTESLESYDGNRLTFLANGIDAQYVAKGTAWFIKKYYSLSGIIARSFHVRLNFWQRLEFVLFNICYRDVYRQWLAHNTLQQPQQLQHLIALRFTKRTTVALAEKLLRWVRRKQANT